jgi:hypothetical protein
LLGTSFIFVNTLQESPYSQLIDYVLLELIKIIHLYNIILDRDLLLLQEFIFQLRLMNFALDMQMLPIVEEKSMLLIKQANQFVSQRRF